MVFVVRRFIWVRRRRALSTGFGSYLPAHAVRLQPCVQVVYPDASLSARTVASFHASQGSLLQELSTVVVQSPCESVIRLRPV